MDPDRYQAPEVPMYDDGWSTDSCASVTEGITTTTTTAGSINGRGGMSHL
jgi:hypothetical protein